MRACWSSWRPSTFRRTGEDGAMSVRSSPSTRSYAAQKGLSVEEIAQSAGRETIGREDVDAHISGGGAPASSGPAANHARYWDVPHAEFGPVKTEPVSRFAKLAADNLSAANATIPQVTHHDQADMRAVEAFRAKMKPEASARGTRLTALAFHVKTLARCLRDFPKFNASLDPKGETMILKDFVHVGIAVDTPHGLMVPVIRNADQKGLFAIADEIFDLASRAQARKIQPNEMGGASMSISNLGGIGGTAFTPIVNPPEVAILGLTRTDTVPRWEDGAWVPVPMVPLDLSYDHRVINGADAARFLARYAELLADPVRLIAFPAE
ncbi:dihydrolipoamide acetyltransferase [Rhodobacterales bacterium HKCCE3408]|nr:dihydrolipoamide acetyltransferase [Rhodobacterales bacterium HKCCE3408]